MSSPVDRRAGAQDGSVAVGPDMLVGAVADLTRTRLADRNLGEGTLGYLNGPSVKYLAYLARGFGEYNVEVCAGLLGRDLYDALKRAGDSCSGLYSKEGPEGGRLWTSALTARVAYAYAGGFCGGRSADKIPAYSMGAADCTKQEIEELEAHVPAADNKFDAVAKRIPVGLKWEKAVQNQIRMFGQPPYIPM